MAGQPAPGRDIHRRPFIAGDQLKDLPGFQPLQPAFEPQEHWPASQVACVPGVVMADRFQDQRSSHPPQENPAELRSAYTPRLHRNHRKLPGEPHPPTQRCAVELGLFRQNRIAGPSHSSVLAIHPLRVVLSSWVCFVRIASRPRLIPPSSFFRPQFVLARGPVHSRSKLASFALPQTKPT